MGNKKMDASEYNQRLEKIKSDFEAAKKALNIEFSTSHRIYKEGDIVKHHDEIIKIDKITTYVSFSALPVPVYHGLNLKKDLTPKKNGDRGSIYGNDNTTKIK